MTYKQSIDGCLEAAIGEHGLSGASLRAWCARADATRAALARQHEDESLPLLRVPEWTRDLADARAALDRLCEGARTLVFLGTGGSSLGGQTVAQLGGWYIPGENMNGGKRMPRTRFHDNLDPRTLEKTLDGLDLAETRFIVTSKSGGTPETLVQALTAIQAVKRAGLGDRVSELFLGISEPARDGGKNGLRDVLEAHGAPLLDHHPGVGGRFSVLTNVGMIPAMARGLDPYAFRAGARAVVEMMLGAERTQDAAPLMGAAAAIGLAEERGVKAHVLMPYTDRLGRFSHWYVQLWAESLGKGGRGTTPLAALGPVDQHSQLQLYLDGPRDHMVTVLRLDCAGTGPVVAPELAALAGADYLAGRSAGDLVAAQQRAIPEALVEAGRPVRTIDVPALDEAALGGLMMHFMLETILAAGLLGVDPFDQPAVEAGKVLTRRYLQEDSQEK